jgi:hypothetical protein
VIGITIIISTPERLFANISETKKTPATISAGIVADFNLLLTK